MTPKKSHKNTYEKLKRSRAAAAQRRWRKNNPEKVAADNARRKFRRCRRSANRWAMILHHVKRRCYYKRRNKETYYTQYGIECKLTVIEIARLWFRDKAWAQRAPHLDRIDSLLGYEFNNCRFIEAEENLARIERKDGRFYKERETQPAGREPGEEG